MKHGKRESRRSHRTADSDAEVGSDRDVDLSDEEGALQRLTRNYRRFSETVKDREDSTKDSEYDEYRCGNSDSFANSAARDDDQDDAIQEDSDEEEDQDQDEEIESQVREDDDVDDDYEESEESAENAEADDIMRTLHAFGQRGDTDQGLRSALGRLFPGTGLGELLGAGGEIQGLVDNLERQRKEDPFLVLEILNQLSERLLMMNGLVAERGVPTYSLAKQLISILHDPMYADHLEVQLVACRCLYNLLEINPDSVHVMVGCGVVEALQDKLADISYIDLAEQALQTLEMISRESGHEVLVRGTLQTYLSYLDFFTIHAQRKALGLVANACEDIPDDKLEDVKSVLPTIERVATTYTDPSCVESAWLIVCRFISSSSHHPEQLEHLLKLDLLKSLVGMIPTCLGKGQHSGVVSFGSCVKLLNSLATLSTASTDLALCLIRDCHIGTTIKSSLLKYEKTDITKPIEPDETATVSTDALMATPKELLMAILKLVVAIAPVLERDGPDLGFFRGSAQYELADRLQAYQESEDFALFASHVFPILLSIYSSTVDYKIRRLVLVCILRLVGAFDKAALSETVFGSNIASVMSSIVTQTRRTLDRDTRGGLDLVRSSLLAYGGLSIVHLLISRAPELFLADFEREGLLSHTENLRSRLEEDDRVTISSSMVSSQMTDTGNDDDQDDEEYLPRLCRASTYDGAVLIPAETALSSLCDLCCKVCDDYQALVASSMTPRSQHLRSLDELKVLLQNSEEVKYDWMSVWAKFVRAIRSSSSFELNSSGIVGVLLNVFRTQSSNSLCCQAFKDTFCSVNSPFGSGEDLPLATLVKMLEEALERTESFELVATEASNAESRASSMAKQIRIRLSSEQDERQLLLMVHAVATFKSIDSFIHARQDRLSTLFKAFANTQTQPNEDPAEFYVEFSIDGEDIPHGTTIYGAIYRSMQETPQQVIPQRHVFMGEPHVVKYRKVPGKLPQVDDELYPYEPLVGSVAALEDKTTLDILQLLKYIHHLNVETPQSGASDVLFLNYRMTAKLNRQLEEPLIVASGTLPDWSVAVTRQFPFLFPLDTRVFFLQSTSFGYSRLIELWQSRARTEEQHDRDGGQRDFSSIELGRPVRHKLRLSRKKLLQGAIKVMDGYASVPGLLEIEYFDEAGTGLGPTLEFYANVSKEFCRQDLQMWRGSDPDPDNQEYVDAPNGLFPMPGAQEKQLHMFSVLGKFVARSLLDSRIVDFNFNSVMFEISSRNHSNDPALQLSRLAKVDPTLFRSLQQLRDCDNVEDLGLTFVVPGYDIEMVPGGEMVAVTNDNLEQYIRLVCEFSVGKGVEDQIKSFATGFSTVFPYTSLEIFSPDELVRLFGDRKEDWSLNTLLRVVHADHGYTLESVNVQNLLTIMSEFDTDDQRKFLQFLTGSPRLPIGGFKALKPDFTVVKKQAEDDLVPDDYLPSVMTCANYLKLPDYSSKEVLENRLLQAMNEGANVFLLS